MKNVCLAAPHLYEERNEKITLDRFLNGEQAGDLEIVKFEKELSSYVGTRKALVLSSGTVAIRLALKSLGVKSGDVVFWSSITYPPSCQAILSLGATPVFIDIDPLTWGMCPQSLRLAFQQLKEKGQRPRAVVVVNLYGQSADMDPILEICHEYGVPVLEEAAESLGATYKGRMSGTLGAVGIYSFNKNKIITTLFGGGALISNDPSYVDKARDCLSENRNDLMSPIAASIGRRQLEVLAKRLERKKEIYETYRRAFKEIGEIEMMNICDYGHSNYWLSVMTVKRGSVVTSKEIMEKLKSHHIESRLVWKPMHFQPDFSDFLFFTIQEGTSIAEDYANRGICLPSDTQMTQGEQERVVNIVKQLFINSK